MSIYEKNKCITENCNSLQRNKGLINGKRIYGNKCVRCHLKGKDDFILKVSKKIINKKCENCGWDKTMCDRHRITPSLGYVESNVKILCPNCHRLATLGLIVF